VRELAGAPPAHEEFDDLDDAFRRARAERNEAWLEFVRAGGYDDERLWSADGWRARHVRLAADA